jgi:class 3 adenylate cyclase
MADIRSFTGLCEHNDPEVVTGMLNRYFSAMSVPIFKHDGMIDKFIGDAIMAVFGAPQEKNQNADNAILAAQEMLAQLAILNSEFAKEGLPQLEIGIGIHSGEAIAGNVGSVSCMDYTVIGDTVNVAARIESQTKALGYNLLISQSTAEQSQLKSLNKVANVRLKGRDQTIDVFSL